MISLCKYLKRRKLCIEVDSLYFCITWKPNFIWIWTFLFKGKVTTTFDFWQWKLKTILDMIQTKVFLFNIKHYSSRIDIRQSIKFTCGSTFLQTSMPLHKCNPKIYSDKCFLQILTFFAVVLWIHSMKLQQIPSTPSIFLQLWIKEIILSGKNFVTILVIFFPPVEAAL